jgi:phage terminase large subunit-like protein
MVEGEAGLLSVFPPDQRPHYEPSRRQITFKNGAIAITYSSEEPDLLRGPAHDAAWVDELAAFYDANLDEADAGSDGTTWSNLQMGLRLGTNPQQVVTTTPKPLKLIKQLLASPTSVITRGSTYENKANLAEAFYTEIISKYEGTRLGRQELHAEVLEDIEGALFQRLWFDKLRIRHDLRPRDLQRVVVAIDPAVTAKETSDDTGIMVAALGVDGRGYLLDDLTCRLSADGWCSRAVAAYQQYNADRIVAEVNNGGDLVETVLRTIEASVSYKAVHAAHGKLTRAEPIAALVEQGKISHVGSFPQLEDELAMYTGKPGEKSPNRLDAYVWAFSELMLEKSSRPRAMWL